MNENDLDEKQLKKDTAARMRIRIVYGLLNQVGDLLPNKVMPREALINVIKSLEVFCEVMAIQYEDERTMQ